MRLRKLNVLFVIALCAGSGFGVKASIAGSDRNPGDDLRSDIADQQRTQDIEREIKESRAVLQDIRQRAQNIRLTIARIKDALANPDCAAVQSSLDFLGDARASNVKLTSTLEKECTNIKPQGQKQLLETCVTERRQLEKEASELLAQENEVYQKCPAFKPAAR
jgi:hypothetical protein